MYTYTYSIHIVSIICFRSMSKSLSFVNSKIQTETHLFLWPMVTSYGHFKFVAISYIFLYFEKSPGPGPKYVNS